MFRPAAAVALGVSLFTAGCGSGSSPSAPSSTSTSTSTTPTNTGTATTATTLTSGVFTFTFAAGTLVQDQTLIRDAVVSAGAFFQSALGRTLAQPTTIAVVATTTGGCASGSAFTAARVVTICGANNGWTNQSAASRQKIAMHELYHALQFEQGWLGTGNVGAFWLVEGSAEYMAWRGAANLGLISFEAARACNVRLANQQAPAGASLSTMETSSGFGNGGYPLSTLGVDQLVSTIGASALIRYGDLLASGTAWQTAFQTSFSTSATVFYNQFTAYRAGLGAGADSCL